MRTPTILLLLAAALLTACTKEHIVLVVPNEETAATVDVAGKTINVHVVVKAPESPPVVHHVTLPEMDTATSRFLEEPSPLLSDKPSWSEKDKPAKTATQVVKSVSETKAATSKAAGPVNPR